MTPFQVCAELSDDHSANEAWWDEEVRRLKKQREIFQGVCYRQGIAAEHLETLPLSELAGYIRAAGFLMDDDRLLQKGLGEFLKGL